MLDFALGAIASLVGVIVVTAVGVFKLVVDTGNPYLDGAIAIVLVGILLGVLVIYRGRRPSKAK